MNTGPGVSVVADDTEEEILAGSIDQFHPASSKKSSKEGKDTEEILNLLKTGNEHTQETIELKPCLLLSLSS